MSLGAITGSLLLVFIFGKLWGRARKRPSSKARTALLVLIAFLAVPALSIAAGLTYFGVSVAVDQFDHDAQKQAIAAIEADKALRNEAQELLSKIRGSNSNRTPKDQVDTLDALYGACEKHTTKSMIDVHLMERKLADALKGDYPSTDDWDAHQLLKQYSKAVKEDYDAGNRCMPHSLRVTLGIKRIQIALEDVTRLARNGGAANTLDGFKVCSALKNAVMLGEFEFQNYRNIPAETTDDAREAASLVKTGIPDTAQASAFCGASGQRG
ncbi:MAG: hypothetical protein B7Y80_04985 [Hyphomicrobium sp. 32-62-53]|nr:MAG: hypothetical protein B7Y80_04985 [Hyphomicrobium sp. 32-62-53]